MMIRPGFLSPEERAALVRMARNGTAEQRVARRANAIVLLNDGWSCEDVAAAFLLDDDTVRDWFKRYAKDGVSALKAFGYEGSACRLTAAQQAALKAWIEAAAPRSTREIGAWIDANFGLSYSQSGVLGLLKRLGITFRRPTVIPRKLDEAKQEQFIEAYEDCLNHLGDDESVTFVDAVHPTHKVRPVGCWGPKDTPVCVEQTSGRERINIHGAIDLETGRTRMIEVPTVNALSTIALLVAIESAYLGKRLIHVFLDNARYHHAALVKAWLSRPDCRIKLHFLPPYCPHLAPIERCWRVMHKEVTHNKCYKSLSNFKNAIMTFLTQTLPKDWNKFRDAITDNFRVISPKKFRVIAQAR
jgi:transposase